MGDIELAEHLYYTDWPNNDWKEHIVNGEPDSTARRYVRLAQTASRAYDAELIKWITREKTERELHLETIRRLAAVKQVLDKHGNDLSHDLPWVVEELEVAMSNPPKPLADYCNEMGDFLRSISSHSKTT